jgi:acetyl-CoA acetyltransferase
MSKLRNVAVVAYSQAPFVPIDVHRTSTEMLYPQVRNALAACGADREAIDYQVAGSADYVDGRVFGFVAAVDVMGSWPPKQDLHLEMDAAFAAYYAWIRMQAGDCDTALVVGYGKPGEGDLDRVLNLQLDPYYQGAMGLDPTSSAALQASAFLERTGVTDRDLAEVAARNRAVGARNPEAQLKDAPTAEQLMKTPWAVEPLRQGYLAPRGETAACLILAAEGKAEKMCKNPVWIHGVDQRAELQSLGTRDLSRSASAGMAACKAFEMAGLKTANDVDVVELASGNAVEEMILREAIGLSAKGEVGPAVNPSGGPLAGDAVMITGLARLGEVFRQLSGQAANPVKGARRALAHATQGHCLQQNLVWVLGNERRWS